MLSTTEVLYLQWNVGGKILAEESRNTARKPVLVTLFPT
jgi:hypothetical protein